MAEIGRVWMSLRYSRGFPLTMRKVLRLQPMAAKIRWAFPGTGSRWSKLISSSGSKPC